MKIKIEKIVGYILMNIGLWAFKQLFKFVDLYSPDKSEDGEVRGITFTNYEEYLDYVSRFKGEGGGERKVDLI